MPRICCSNNEPVDFCNNCFPCEEDAEMEYNTHEHGPDDRGNCFEYNADHPDYNTTNYRCIRCKRFLTRHDNFQ